MCCHTFENVLTFTRHTLSQVERFQILNIFWHNKINGLRGVSHFLVSGIRFEKEMIVKLIAPTVDHFFFKPNSFVEKV